MCFTCGSDSSSENASDWAAVLHSESTLLHSVHGPFIDLIDGISILSKSRPSGSGEDITSSAVITACRVQPRPRSQSRGGHLKASCRIQWRCSCQLQLLHPNGSDPASGVLYSRKIGVKRFAPALERDLGADAYARVCLGAPDRHLNQSCGRLQHLTASYKHPSRAPEGRTRRSWRESDTPL